MYKNVSSRLCNDKCNCDNSSININDEVEDEKSRFNYHLKKDSGMWKDSKELVKKSELLSPLDMCLYDFMEKYVMSYDNFLRDIEGIHYYSEDTKDIIKLTGVESWHFVENYKIPATIPKQNMLYSMLYGKLDNKAYNVYIYVYFKDTIVDFTNGWTAENPYTSFNIIPRNP